MNVDIIAKTDGKGLWSEEAREVKITKVTIANSSLEYFPEDPFYGELRAHFEPSGYTPGSWNVPGYGLIYTDKLWLREFKAGLRAAGLSRRAVQDISYSEQGLQGESFVSMDIGAAFYASWKRVNKVK